VDCRKSGRVSCRGVQLLLVEDKQAKDDQRKEHEQEDWEDQDEFGQRLTGKARPFRAKDCGSSH
jgi:hypothetical protein